MWRFAAPTLWTALSPQGKPPGVSPKSTVESTSQPAPRRGRSSPRGRQLGQARRVTWRPAAFVARYVSPWYVTKSRTIAAPHPAGRSSRAALRASFSASSSESDDESESEPEELSGSSAAAEHSSMNALPCTSLRCTAGSPARRCRPSSFCEITCFTRPVATSCVMAQCVSVGVASAWSRYMSSSHGQSKLRFFFSPGSPCTIPAACASVHMPVGPL